MGNLAGDALHAEIFETMCMMHGWAPHVAIGQQGLIRCTPVLACSPPSKEFLKLGPAGVGAVNPRTFRRNMYDVYKRNWAGLHDSPRTAPAARAKSCTYLRWFARPGKMPTEPYYELPISLSKLRRLMQFRLGSHDLPIEQGCMARPMVPRYVRRCTLCSQHAPGDERHFMLECPQFDDIRAQYPDLLQDARDPCAT